MVMPAARQAGGNYDKVQIAKTVNVEIISLDDAPKGSAEFDNGVAKKFITNPHHLIPA